MSTMMATVVVLMVLINSILKTKASTTPLKPENYSTLMGNGFTTKYFKSLNFDTEYNKQHVADVYNRGFRNLRIRCRADLEGLNMTVFLKNLDTVIDDCLNGGIYPVVSWIHYAAEAFATEQDRLNYIDWWKTVATKLKDKDYRLSYNLFTELGIDHCLMHPNLTKSDCDGSLRVDTNKYNNWTASVVTAIRATGGNNAKRILHLGAPKKTADGLDLIDSNIYKNDSYIMVEWHNYASGPNKITLRNGTKHEKYWEGDGTVFGRTNCVANIDKGKKYMNDTGLKTYFAEWMPMSNKRGHLNESEVLEFAKFFVKTIKPIPWSLNSLHKFYDVKKNKWIDYNVDISEQSLNMSKILQTIIDGM